MDLAQIEQDRPQIMRLPVLRNGRVVDLSPDQVEEHGWGYFRYCEANEVKPLYNGLLLWLGMGRREFEDLTTDMNYKRIVLRLKQVCEAYLEEVLLEKSPGLLAKNYYGFVEKVETKHSGDVENPVSVGIFQRMGDFAGEAREVLDSCEGRGITEKARRKSHRQGVGKEEDFSDE